MKSTLIDKAFELHHWIIKNLDGLEVSRERRALLSVSCYDTVIEHHIGISTLLKSNINGSAFALVRPLFETFVRGVWLRHCATEDEIDKYVSDRLDKKFYQLIEEVEKLESFRDGVLSGLKESAWKAMNSYTHGGIQQVGRRSKDAYIEPDYSDEEVIEVVKLSGSFALLSLQQIAFEVGENELAIEAIDMLNGVGRE